MNKQPGIVLGFDAKRLFNNFTGLGNYSRTLVSNLQRHAPENTYILYSETIRRTLSTDAFTNADRYRIVTTKGIGRKLWRIFSIRKNLAADSVQVFHGLSHDLPFGPKPRDVRYVVTIHDVCYRTFPEMFSLADRVVYGFKYRNALKKADRIVAISQSTKNDILSCFPWVDPRRIEVVYQAIDPVYYTLPEIAQERSTVARHGVQGDYILYVGSINSRKNLLGVVKAYKHLREEERLPLVVIGNGRGYKRQVEAFAHAEGLERHITFLGNVDSPKNLRAFYRCARLLVYPSFYEGFGLPVAEALLCRTPVVTSSVSSLPEAGGEYAVYVNPKSETQIASAIGKLLGDAALCRELGEQGREFVMRTFAPEMLSRQMTTIYDRLVNKA